MTHHSRRLFGLMVRILNDRDEAEAVLQDVFEQVWTRAGTYTPALGSPAGWLVGIARTRAIDRRRAGARAPRRRSRCATGPCRSAGTGCGRAGPASVMCNER